MASSKCKLYDRMMINDSRALLR